MDKIGRLRALEKDIRESVALSTAEALGVMGINRPAKWADELATLIAELGQEVGAVEPVGYMDPDADFMLPRKGQCVLSSHVVLVRDPHGKYTRPLYTYPAHTSEARDCPAPPPPNSQEHEMSDEYAILRAAHAAGARIQVWRLNEDAHHAFDGHWENIDGRPRFLQPLHLYRIDPDSIAAPSSEASEGVAVTNEMVLKAAEAFVMHRGCVDQTVSHGPIRAALEAALHPATAHTSEAMQAARYRWIRKNSAVRFFDKDNPSDYGSLKNDVELDAAIDAAMRQEVGTP